MEENKSSKRNSLIIGVVVIFVLIIGASYAYFAVGTTNNFGTSTISATTDSVGTVTLSNINSTLYIDLTAADMMRSTSCITDTKPIEECTCGTSHCNHSEIHYYATPSGKSTNQADRIQEIARATVTPSTDENYYSCNYTLSISHTGTNDMYTRFNTNYANKGEWQIILYIGNQTYDWDDGFPSTHTGNIMVSVGNPASINAGLRIINNGEIDQTHLAGTDIAITLQATSFSCTALSKEFVYYNETNKDNPLTTPGEMTYYIKETRIDGLTVDYEVCAVIGSTTVCMPYNAGENYQTYASQLTTAGATCNTASNYHTCTYNNNTIYISTSGEFVRINLNNGSQCYISASQAYCNSNEPTG